MNNSTKRSHRVSLLVVGTVFTIELEGSEHTKRKRCLGVDAYGWSRRFGRLRTYLICISSTNVLLQQRSRISLSTCSFKPPKSVVQYFSTHSGIAFPVSIPTKLTHLDYWNTATSSGSVQSGPVDPSQDIDAAKWASTATPATLNADPSELYNENEIAMLGRNQGRLDFYSNLPVLLVRGRGFGPCVSVEINVTLWFRVTRSLCWSTVVAVPVHTSVEIDLSRSGWDRTISSRLLLRDNANRKNEINNTCAIVRICLLVVYCCRRANAIFLLIARLSQSAGIVWEVHDHGKEDRRVWQWGGILCRSCIHYSESYCAYMHSKSQQTH